MSRSLLNCRREVDGPLLSPACGCPAVQVKLKVKFAMHGTGRPLHLAPPTRSARRSTRRMGNFRRVAGGQSRYVAAATPACASSPDGWMVQAGSVAAQAGPGCPRSSRWPGHRSVPSAEVAPPCEYPAALVAPQPGSLSARRLPQSRRGRNRPAFRAGTAHAPFAGAPPPCPRLAPRPALSGVPVGPFAHRVRACT